MALKLRQNFGSYRVRCRKSLVLITLLSPSSLFFTTSSHGRAFCFFSPDVLPFNPFLLQQPNFVQGLHNLLLQSTANDTVQLKAVRDLLSFTDNRFDSPTLWTRRRLLS